jgi:hypothetical protein
MNYCDKKSTVLSKPAREKTKHRYSLFVTENEAVNRSLYTVTKLVTFYAIAKKPGIITG